MRLKIATGISVLALAGSFPAAAQDALEQAQADLAAASEGEREAAQQALSEAQFELESALA